MTVRDSHSFSAGEVKLSGVLKEEPSVFGRSQYFNLGQFFIRTQKLPSYHFGDKILVLGEVNENGYLHFPMVKKEGESESTFIRLFKPIVTLREKLKGNFEILFGEPHSSLLIGMLIGVDKLSNDLKQMLIRTGTIHVVVVSGFNVSLVIGVVFNLIKSDKKLLSIIVATLITFLYVILTGANPPVVRAALMGTLGFIGSTLGRRNEGLLLLLITAYIMIYLNPIYITSISFQFSFLATLGLILWERSIRGYTTYLNTGIRGRLIIWIKYFGIKKVNPDISFVISKLNKVLISSFSSTLAATIMVFPLISYYFGRISILSPVINTIILWSVPLITIMSVVIGLTSLFNIYIVSLIKGIVYWPMAYFVFIVRSFSNIKLASVDIKLNIFSVIVIYMTIIGVIVINIYKNTSKHKEK